MEDDSNKDCLKKLCKKIKKLEKDLYEVSRQRDEALIIRTTIERENQEMFDRVGELESLLKSADKRCKKKQIHYFIEYLIYLL